MLLKLEENDEAERQYPEKSCGEHVDSERIFTEPFGEFLIFQLKGKNQRVYRYSQENRNNCGYE